MATETSITCDQCGDVLNVDSSMPARYGFRLEERNYGTNTTGMVFAVQIGKTLDRPKDFCGLLCLTKWLGATARQ